MNDDRFKKLFAESRELLVIANLKGYFEEMNLRWLELFGLTAEEWKTRPYLDFIHPDDREFTQNQINKLLKGQSYLELENRFCSKDGDYHWLQWNIIYSEDGRCFYGAARDITSLKNKEILLEKIQEVGKIGYWSVKVGASKPHWSSGTYHIHEVPLHEEVPLEEAIGFYVGDSQQKITEDFGKALSDGIPFDGTYEFMDRKQQRKWVRSVGIAKKNHEGVVDEVQGIFQDITSKRQSDETIKLTKKRLELALEASDIGVWEFDVLNGSLIWDERMYKIYGIRESDFSGAYDAWSKGLHPDDMKKAEAEVAKAVETQGEFNSEFRVVWPDGTIRYVKAKASTIVNSLGQVSQLLGVNWDITEARNAAQQLELERNRAESANRAKSEFLSHMSHEIRTPMNGLMGFLSLLAETHLTSEQREYLKTIMDSSNSLYSLINDILDYSKIEARQMKLKKTQVRINETMATICRLFSASALQKGVEIHFHSELTANTAAYLDELRLKQILSNLIGNAAKFTEQGSIRLTANYEKKTSTLIFHVQDTGIGMKPEVIDLIFKPFNQLDDANKNPINGTGLGLAIVAQLVELMDGEISVTSQVGQGSEFTVRLPTELTQVDETATQKSRENDDVTGEWTQKNPILVVDDNPINRDLIEARLSKMGLKTTLCHSGEQAIALCKDQAFALIFMDIQMPDLDGYATTAIIQQHLQDKAPPIVALTANAFDDDRSQSLQAGMVGHLNKPLRKKELIAILKKHLA